MKRFLISVVLMLAFILGATSYEGARLTILVGISPFAFVLIIPFVSVFAVWGFREIGSAFRAALGKAPEVEGPKRCLLVWELFEKMTYTAGFMGLVLGSILLLRRLSDPRMIGQGLGVCLLSLVYAFVLGIIARILRARVEERLAE
jgi:hypothetical protein